MNMKKLIFIGGTMGVGKTEVGQLLKKRFDRCVYLDGDWCWNMSPFIVTDETKKYMLDNISYLIKNFIACSEIDTVVFTWVMHEQGIIDSLLSMVGEGGYEFYNFSLVCSPETLVKRLSRDVENGIRTSDVIARSVPRLPLYDKINSFKINTDGLAPAQTADAIEKAVNK